MRRTQPAEDCTVRPGSSAEHTDSTESLDDHRPISRRDALKAAGLAGAAALSTGAVSVCAHAAAADPMQNLVAAARAEGQLAVMGLPRDWCGYGAIIDGFKARYGLTVKELRPSASSADQIEAIKAGRAKADYQIPDVIEVGVSFASSAKQEGLLLPYKVSKWETIPGGAKDAQAHWYGGYYGAIAFEINADLVAKIPQDWSDLAAPEYRNSVGLAGNVSSNQAIQSILAAGLSGTKGNADEAAAQGLKFFADLNEKGNFVPVIGDSNSLVQSRTPILIRWDYLALADRDRLGGTARIEVVRPRTGFTAGLYVQAISAGAQHPNAARLWMEYLYSDEVQLAWLKGQCYPIRIADLVRNGSVPIDWRGRLQHPDIHDPDKIFPTLEDQERARDVITNGWDEIVGVRVRCLPDKGYDGPVS
ncbi:MAG: ABC transporter substrate-binding protein [Mesorhizobium sp.]|nr:MAG: ABC transporter substrate-binding protein [Mesorhizobium sp.]